ncbi:hypothetical protein DDZ14_17585 [Maritimibacter sp. 55A14]|uniref:hypothetical protein n=1 Tax=Maritimibacter sp. 55A14 TaxID=2174844 RepID=UPI000D604EF1|nr:hypothetical protein [Maritimibacter sp. 55A14]PWE29319.1 hypothetical protein DDZ14_17585 [Maritimibacter sp. 55A14]
MSSAISDVLARIRSLEDELEEEFAARRARFRYRVERHRVIFEESVRRQHAALRAHLWPYIRRARPMVVITAPAIYAVIVPLVLLDLFVTLYQGTCFPVYGIARVPRRNYIVLDRHHLAYLNGLEKLNCAYCGYANGLIAYTREIAARTEQYWCPIKHAQRVSGVHGRYPRFSEYGDAESYHYDLARLRDALCREKERL